MSSVNVPESLKLEKKYPQIVNHLRKRINNGKLSGALPGVKQLAKEYDANFMTVNKAVKVLEAEGLVYRVPRKGTYVKRIKNIAFCFQGSALELRIDSVFAGMFIAAQRYLSGQNCPMFLESSMSIRKQSMQMLKNRIDGMIFSGDPADVISGDMQSLPLVRVLGEVNPEDHYDHVGYSNREIGVLAARFILQHGHRHIAYIGDQIPPRFVERRDIFIKTAEQGGGRVEFSPYEASTWEPRCKNIALQMRHIFGKDAKDRPTAIFCPSDNEIGMIYDNLYKSGLSPMRDVLIVSCNYDAMMLGYCDPAPVSIDIRMEDIGALAAQRVLERLNFPHEKRRIDILKPIIVNK